MRTFRRTYPAATHTQSHTPKTEHTFRQWTLHSHSVAVWSTFLLYFIVCLATNFFRIAANQYRVGMVVNLLLDPTSTCAICGDCVSFFFSVKILTSSAAHCFATFASYRNSIHFVGCLRVCVCEFRTATMMHTIQMNWAHRNNPVRNGKLLFLSYIKASACHCGLRVWVSVCVCAMVQEMGNDDSFGWTSGADVDVDTHAMNHSSRDLRRIRSSTSTCNHSRWGEFR